MDENPISILCVDDEPGVLNSLARMLRRWGYTYVTAGSADEGLQVLQEHPVQLVLSDYRMPGAVGTTFLKQVSQLYPHTVRIILSGYAQLTPVQEALKAGEAHCFLSKPWDEQELRSTLKKYLSVPPIQAQRAL